MYYRFAKYNQMYKSEYNDTIQHYFEVLYFQFFTSIDKILIFKEFTAFNCLILLAYIFLFIHLFCNIQDQVGYTNTIMDSFWPQFLIIWKTQINLQRIGEKI